MYFKIHAHYILSVQVQDFVSGRACGVDKYYTDATSSDAVSSHDRRELIQSHIPTHYYPIMDFSQGNRSPIVLSG